MKEQSRRELDQVTRRLKYCETALDTARENFAKVIYDLVENQEVSLGEVSRTLKQLGRPISRQRVHQITKTIQEES